MFDIYEKISYNSINVDERHGFPCTRSTAKLCGGQNICRLITRSPSGISYRKEVIARIPKYRQAEPPNKDTKDAVRIMTQRRH